MTKPFIVKLQLANDYFTPVYVNFNQVEYYIAHHDENFTRIVLNGRDKHIMVVETPDEIRAKMEHRYVSPSTDNKGCPK